MLKKLGLVVFLAFLLTGCKPGTKGKATPTPETRRQLINEMEYAKRPFVVVFPHATNKLLTLYIDNVQPEFKSATMDLEYLSGNALKGGRTSLNFPVNLPYAQAFLLGSCSSGGKCSFDTNLISGTIKNRLETGDRGAINILKSDYVFVSKGSVISPDGRVNYTPKDKLVNQILLDTQGLPKALGGQPAYSPIAISSISEKNIAGELSFKVKDVKSVMIYNGESYAPLKATISADEVVISFNQKPWSKTVQIVRDDLKGASETQNIYMLGPIILLK